MEDSLLTMQKDISGYVGKTLRDSFGKGPQTIITSVGYTFVTIYLRNFLTPSEQVLLQQDQIMTILQMRSKLMETIIPELKVYIEIATGKKIGEVYYDWNFHNRSGMITCISTEEITDKTTLNEDFEGKKDVDQEIIAISQQAQKAPEEIYSCAINDRTIVIIRNGILVRIEKELIRLGYSELLSSVKRMLEKKFLHNNNRMELIVNQQIVDSFVDWDFKLDKSVILLILQPSKPTRHNFLEVDVE